jgi:hypothetical protein
MASAERSSCEGELNVPMTLDHLSAFSGLKLSHRIFALQRKSSAGRRCRAGSGKVQMPLWRARGYLVSDLSPAWLEVFLTSQR